MTVCALSIVPQLRPKRGDESEREREIERLRDGEKSCRVGSIVKCACLVMRVTKAMAGTRTKGLI